MKELKTTLLLTIVFWVIPGLCWIINLLKLLNCDFESPWKQEIIHSIGVFTFWGSCITVWF